MRNIMSNTSGNILTRWQTSLKNVACSPLEFYELVERSLIESELPNLSFSQITRNEGGWFSPRRVYLRIRYQKLYFDVSAFVGGNALIVGWWLHEDAPGVADLLAELPGFGFLAEKTSRAATYYKVDFIEYFQRAVHASILQVIDRLSEENGLAYLPDKARIPVWEEIW
jgi:hypothetical protein